MRSSGRNFDDLVRALTEVHAECEWVEFKTDHADPDAIGTYLSALSNGAALHGQTSGYLVWGVEDASHLIVGTSFDPDRAKKGGEDLVPWLTRGLTPQRWFEFSRSEVDGHQVVVLEVEAAKGAPTSFNGQRWIRIGSYRKRLEQYPVAEKDLWLVLLDEARRQHPALTECSGSEVLELLDVEAFLRLTGRSDQTESEGQLELLQAGRLIEITTAGRFDIAAHAALLFARDLSAFAALASKTVRLLEYDSEAKTGSPVGERTFHGGYAAEFEAVFDDLASRITEREFIEGARRLSIPSYPPLAIREVLANALIHQDLRVHGAGPVVEVFSNRIEVSNPGTSLVELERLLDHPPRSRNEQVADTMYQLGFCEKRGSGIDKVIEQIDQLQHPPPSFRATADSLTVTLFDGAVATSLRKEERIRAIYHHACLQQVNGGRVTNESIRARFGLKKEQASLASRYIKEAVDAGLLAPFDIAAGRKSRSYVPSWAASSIL